MKNFPMRFPISHTIYIFYVWWEHRATKGKRQKSQTKFMKNHLLPYLDEIWNHIQFIFALIWRRPNNHCSAVKIYSFIWWSCGFSQWISWKKRTPQIHIEMDRLISCVRTFMNFNIFFFCLLTFVMNLVRCNLMNDFIFLRSVIFMLLNSLIPEIYSYGKPLPVYSGKWTKKNHRKYKIIIHLFTLNEIVQLARKFGSNQLPLSILKPWTVEIPWCHCELSTTKFWFSWASPCHPIQSVSSLELWQSIHSDILGQPNVNFESYRLQCKKAIEISSTRAIENHWLPQMAAIRELSMVDSWSEKGGSHVQWFVFLVRRLQLKHYIS